MYRRGYCTTDVKHCVPAQTFDGATMGQLTLSILWPSEGQRKRLQELVKDVSLSVPVRVHIGFATLRPSTIPVREQIISFHDLGYKRSPESALYAVGI